MIKKIFYSGLILFLNLINCRVNLIPKVDNWFSQHYVTMQDWERKFYKELSLEGKERFKKIFWESREPDARKIFQRRMDTIEKIFKKENFIQPWNTDRARIFLINGDPQFISYKESDDWYEPRTSGVFKDREFEDIQSRMQEIWTYQFGRHIIEYRFNFYPPNEWRLDTAAYRNPFLVEFEKANRDITYGVVDKDYYLKLLSELKKK